VAAEVLRPWTLRMMASEPEEIFLGNLGPLLGRPATPMKRVRAGMGAILEAARKRFEILVGHAASTLLFQGGRVVGASGVGPRGRAIRQRADLVVIATPAPAAARLVGDLPRLATELGQLVYRPVATVVARYAAVEFPGGLSGMFLPRGQAASHIARYDDHERVRFSFAGVAARAAFRAVSAGNLITLGEAAFRRYGGRLGARLSHLERRWDPGLCAHSWMHHRTMASLREAWRSVGGLALTGDYYRGNSLEACVVAARENVDLALERLVHALARDERDQLAFGVAERAPEVRRSSEATGLGRKPTTA
jgi:oxygen-dependent protoporphyrinogen oxidase